MKNLSLILRIVAVVAAIAATTLFFISKGKLAEKNSQLTQTKQVLASTQNELSETNKTLERTESELKTERDVLAQTQDSLRGVRSELAVAEEDARRNKTQLDQTREQVANLERTSRELRADLLSTKEALTTADRTAEINQLNAQIAEIENRNRELALELEAKTVIVDAAAAQVAAKGGPSGIAAIDTSVAQLVPGQPISSRLKLETTISSVRAADGLIVLNTTEELSLSEGQTITLVQNMKSVGKVQIQSVEENYVIANILPNGSGTKKLSAGSTVQILL